MGAAMQQAFAQHLAVGVDGFAPRRVQVRKFLAFTVVADIAGTIAHMEKETGHVFGPPDKKQRRRSATVPVRFPGIVFLRRELARTAVAPL